MFNPKAWDTAWDFIPFLKVEKKEESPEIQGTFAMIQTGNAPHGKRMFLIFISVLKSTNFYLTQEDDWGKYLHEQTKYFLPDSEKTLRS